MRGNEEPAKLEASHLAASSPIDEQQIGSRLLIVAMAIGTDWVDGDRLLNFISMGATFKFIEVTCLL